MADIARVTGLGQVVKVNNENQVVISVKNRKNAEASYFVLNSKNAITAQKGQMILVNGTIVIEKINDKPTPTIQAFLLAPVSTDAKQFMQITVDGNITRDADLVTAGTVNITKTAVAVNTYKKGAPNDQMVSFYNLTIFNRDALLGMLKKGTIATCIVGDLQVNAYKNGEGEARVDISINVQDINFFNKAASNAPANSAPAQDSAPAPTPTPTPDEDLDEDEIPF